MTEEQWFQEPHWERLVELLRPHLSVRKERLLAAGFCRLLGDHIEDDAVQDAIACSEQFADRQISVKEIEDARYRCRILAQQCSHRLEELGADDTDAARLREELRRDFAWLGAFVSAGQLVLTEIATRTEQIVLLAEARDTPPGEGHSALARHREAQRQVLFDLVGNPVRPVLPAASWRSATVLALARAIEASRDFSTAPILADALEDAGCDSEEVLAHLREPRPHSRGCWVLDLVLDRQ